jgi:hypothetical protein
VRVIIGRLLQERPPTPAEIARVVNDVLRRTEEARIYAWYHQTNDFPPRRRSDAGPTGAPKIKRLQ